MINLLQNDLMMQSLCLKGFFIILIFLRRYVIIMSEYFKKLRNYDWCLCLPQKLAKTQPAFWTAFFHDKFTLWHIKVTAYRKINLLLTNSTYLVYFHRLKHTTSFLFWLKGNVSQIFKSTSCKKTFSPVCGLLVQLASMFFISCDNWRVKFFVKIYRYLEVLFNHHVFAFWERRYLKEACIFFISKITV